MKINSIDFTKFFIKKFSSIKVKNKTNRLSLHEPNFTNLEKKYLTNCLKSTFVSTSGFYNEEFTKRLKKNN